MATGHSNAARYKSAANRRTAFMEVMRRRIRPGRGSSLALLRSRESYPMPDLKSLLPGVRFVVVGGTATSLYMPLRTTKDVDILVATADAPTAERALVQAGATLLGPLSIHNPLRIAGNAWRLPDGSELDVLRSGRPWAKEALAHSHPDAAGLPIVTLPYLVLMKLASGRGLDLGDISRMLGGADENALDAVRQVVSKYLPDALDDVKSLAELGRLEFESDSSAG
ncbi:MAG: hypothetical protein EPO21_16090 [Chloroflexota bacterium]|nr:MAG: hypothetical protein EPO21_16090 [Chloroflexota bacterium]